jgi:hypothetical protein
VGKALLLSIVVACDPPATETETREHAAPVEPSSPHEATPEQTGPHPTSVAAPIEAMGLPEPATTLPLTLMATMASPDPKLARATIRDEDRGVIATYRVGEALRDDVHLVAVDRRFAVIEHDDGRREAMTMGDGTVEISADDVFYPDLVDDLDLPNSMADAVQLTSGPGYTVKTPNNAWGTPKTIHLLREAMRVYGTMVRGGPNVHIGDVSKREGGPFPPHISHQAGRDVDIGYVLRGPRSDDRRFLPAVPGNLDRERTWTLVESLLATDGVSYIFMDYAVQGLLYEHARAKGVETKRLRELFQYPNGRYAWSGKIRHWRGHDDHFHLRFRSG